jgi:dimeric dUTPase (all-alpha-NTP-PPase superfamily)
MNLTKLFKIQAATAEMYEKKHPAQPGENRHDKKVLALIVEVSECANEWRGFKYWSKDQTARTELYNFIGEINGERLYKTANPLLEEYVDGLHFVLELGLLVGGFADKGWVFPKGKGEPLDWFLQIFSDINDFVQAFQGFNKQIAFLGLLEDYIQLGASLGFTWEEIEQAYLDKNKINYQRQSEGY